MSISKGKHMRPIEAGELEQYMIRHYLTSTLSAKDFAVQASRELGFRVTDSNVYGVMRRNGWKSVLIAKRKQAKPAAPQAPSAADVIGAAQVRALHTAVAEAQSLAAECRALVTNVKGLFNTATDTLQSFKRELAAFDHLKRRVDQLEDLVTTPNYSPKPANAQLLNGRHHS